MEVYINRAEEMLEVKVTGHTDTEYCNAVSCIMWSLLAYAANYAEVEYRMGSGNSHIIVSNISPDVSDFIETAFEQIAFNKKDIKIKKEA